MTKILLPMAKMPAAISESVSHVLGVHGLSLSPDVLRELGNNVTQALYNLDESLDDSTEGEPSMADRLAVGETLRALAMMERPNPETAKALGRVGDWLSATAKIDLVKVKGGKAA